VAKDFYTIVSKCDKQSWYVE